MSSSHFSGGFTYLTPIQFIATPYPLEGRRFHIPTSSVWIDDTEQLKESPTTSPTRKDTGSIPVFREEELIIAFRPLCNKTEPGPDSIPPEVHELVTEVEFPTCSLYKKASSNWISSLLPSTSGPVLRIADKAAKVFPAPGLAHAQLSRPAFFANTTCLCHQFNLTSRAEHVYQNRLSRVQRLGALWVTSTCRTVSELAMIVIARVFPIHHLAMERQAI
ncbi:hypothetical protein J6590_002571 [Homalodisca vitripennis]|nr:hypothetical protein J6590_002571 [Homalodisca vitripennis]